MGDITTSLLQTVRKVCQWKNFENPLIIGDDIDKSKVARFLLAHGVYTGSKTFYRLGTQVSFFFSKFPTITNSDKTLEDNVAIFFYTDSYKINEVMRPGLFCTWNSTNATGAPPFVSSCSRRKPGHLQCITLIRNCHRSHISTSLLLTVLYRLMFIRTSGLLCVAGPMMWNSFPIYPRYYSHYDKNWICLWSTTQCIFFLTAPMWAAY